jgi:hypothetical protein
MVNETGDGWVSMDMMNKTMQLNFLRLPHRASDAGREASKGKDRAENDKPNKLAWKHLPLPFPIADFGVDANQDLLVLMQRHGCVDLLSLVADRISTDKPPSARLLSFTCTHFLTAPRTRKPR